MKLNTQSLTTPKTQAKLISVSKVEGSLVAQIAPCRISNVWIFAILVKSFDEVVRLNLHTGDTVLIDAQTPDLKIIKVDLEKRPANAKPITKADCLINGKFPDRRLACIPNN